MFRKYAGSFLAIMARMLSSLAVNKLFAFYFGTAGITTLAHLQNLIGLVILVPTDGVERGMVKYLSDRRFNTEVKRQYLWAGLLWHLIVFIAASALIFVLRKYLLAFFPKDFHPVLWYAVLMGAIGLQMAYLIGLSFLLIRQKLKSYVGLTVLSSFILISAVSIGVYLNNLSIALLSFALGQALPFFVLVLLFYRLPEKLPYWKGVKLADYHTSLINIGKYSIMAFSIVCFSKVVDFYIRQLAIMQFGYFQTGLWQAAVKLSDMYKQLFIALLGIVFYPKLSLLIHKRKATELYLLHTLRLWLPAIGLGLLLVFALKKWLLLLFFNPTFVQAAPILTWQLVGDLFSLSSYFFAYILLAKAYLRVFVILQAFSAALQLSFLYLFLLYADILAFPLAYVCQSFGYCLSLILTFRMVKKGW